MKLILSSIELSWISDLAYLILQYKCASMSCPKNTYFWNSFRHSFVIPWWIILIFTHNLYEYLSNIKTEDSMFSPLVSFFCLKSYYKAITNSFISILDSICTVFIKAVIKEYKCIDPFMYEYLIFVYWENEMHEITKAFKWHNIS